MNRQDAKLLGFSKEARKTEYSGNYIHFDNVIDIVFDDWESRTCENCKYWIENIHMCVNKKSFAYKYKATALKTDGCNKHEPKET